MAIVGREKLNHPPLGTVGGAGLYAAIDTIFTKLSDDVPGRFVPFTGIANSGVVTVDHNFGVDVADISKYIYTGTFPALTRVVNPTASGWSVAPTTGFLKTKIDITVPATGGPFSGVVFLTHGHQTEYLADLLDVNLTTPPQDGQALVYDAGTAKFKPGASGDSSFKIQDVQTPNLILKGGYLYLTQDQRELATWNTLGSTSVNYGVDLTLNLTTIFGATPANAAFYYLYIDLSTLSNSSNTQTDTGRVVYPVGQSNFFLSVSTPEMIDATRYLPVGTVKSANSGNAWSGTGSGFSTEAKFRVQTGLAIGDKDVYNWVVNPRAIVSNRSVNVYNDAAPIPLDGNGGTPTDIVPVVRNVTSPLSGRADFKISKNAANAQGQGWAWDVAVPKGWQVGRQCEHTVLIDTTHANFLTGDLVVYVYDITNNYMITPSSQILPQNFKGPWTLSWDSHAGVPAYRLLYHVASTNPLAWDVSVDELVMGPGKVATALARSETHNVNLVNDVNQSFTGNSFLGSWNRTGEYMHLKGSIGFGTIAAWNASTLFVVKIPTNLTADLTYFGTGSELTVGHAKFLKVSAGYQDYEGSVNVYGTDNKYLFFKLNGSTAALSDVSSPPVSNNDILSFSATIQIKEWTGQGDVNLGSNNVEYLYNSGGWNTDDSTSFASGQAGAVITGALSTLRQKYVQTLTPITPRTKLTLKFSTDGITWLDTGGTLNVQRTRTLTSVPGGFAGATLASVGPYQVIVQFGNFQDYDFGGASGAAWTLGYWRIEKEEAGVASGFGHVQQELSGLVSSAGQLLGTNTNDLAGVGNVGEVREQIFGVVANANGQGANLTAVAFVTLTAGEWDVFGTSLYTGGSTVSSVACMVTSLSSSAAYTRVTSAFFSDAVCNHEFSFVSFPAGGSGVATTGAQTVRIPFGTSVVYQTMVFANGGPAGNTVIYGSIKARRVR